MKLKILGKKELRNKVGLVIGTRPGIVMFSPIIRECEKQKLNYFIIHAGQHYSYNMDKEFFEDLKLPAPEYRLDNVKRSKFHGAQTAKMLEGIERILMKEKPRIVLVGGDANCNLAGALAARKLHIKAGHIEAGERSFDWRMPEEHNRVIIDHISDYLFTTNAKGKDNLIRDRVRGKIFTVGNPIVDAVYQNLGVAEKNSQILEEYGLRKKEYFLLTLHREENVDVKANLKNILKAMSLVCSNFKRDIIFLIHPRTKKRIKEFNLSGIAKSNKGLRIKNATGYLDFLKLLNNASLVFTDSGGVQQEACILGIPCVTLRDNTEWVETVKIGANITSGTEPNRILSDTGLMLKRKNNWNHTFGDGKTAQYIVEIIKGKLESD